MCHTKLYHNRQHTKSYNDIMLTEQIPITITTSHHPPPGSR